jgi:hypothetical protein
MSEQPWESCIFNPDRAHDFIKNYMGPTLWRNNMKDKNLIAWDHNRDFTYHYVAEMLNDPETAKYIWGTGVHWYDRGRYDNVAQVNKAFPCKKLAFTEGCVEGYKIERIACISCLPKGKSTQPVPSDEEGVSAVGVTEFLNSLAAEEDVQAPGQLNYSIPNQPETTHDLLLQKSNGNFVLVLWGERFASGGSDNIQLNLGKTRGKVTVYDPTLGTEAIQELNNVDTVSLSLTDHPLIIELS